MIREGINRAIKNSVMKLVHQNENANWERDIREVYMRNGMSLRKGEMTWESEVVLRIETSPNGQSFWTKDHILTNDQDETYTDH